MKKMLLAVACLGMAFSSVNVLAERRKEVKAASLEDLILAVDNLSRVEERLANIKGYMGDAKIAVNPLEKGWNLGMVLEILYDSIIKQLVGVAKGLTAIKGLGEKPSVKKLMDSIKNIDDQLQVVPEVVKALDEALTAQGK